MSLISKATAVPRNEVQQEADSRLLLAISCLDSRQGIDFAGDYCVRPGIFRSSRSRLVTTKSTKITKNRSAVERQSDNPRCASFRAFVIFVLSVAQIRYSERS
jgi:hypothetical protein